METSFSNFVWTEDIYKLKQLGNINELFYVVLL